MFIQLFSNYLVGQSVITIEQRDTFQEEIQKTRVKLGTIAIAEGLLTEAQAEEINHQQTCRTAASVTSLSSWNTSRQIRCPSCWANRVMCP